MENGKQYLIIRKKDNGHPAIELAFWLFERRTKWYTCVEGFYGTDHFTPYKNVVKYIELDKIPDFTSWEVKEPIEGERYLVYRVGAILWHPPHYTIRKFHNGSFGSNDVKYWIELSKLSSLITHEFS